MGLIPEEIARKFGHLSLAQVHTALAYYHANRGEIDRDLESEAREAEAREELHRVVPPREIDRAVERKKQFETNPSRHTYQEAEHG